MSLSKSKWWYSNNCLHFVRCTVLLCTAPVMFRVLQSLTHTFYTRLTNTLAYLRHLWRRRKRFCMIDFWSFELSLSSLCQVQTKQPNMLPKGWIKNLWNKYFFLFRKIDKFLEKKIFSKNDCFFRDLMPLMCSWSAGLISFGIFFL